jgi:hypothetical protein
MPSADQDAEVFDPYDRDKTCPQAISAVLLHIRSQLGATNWDDFCDRLLELRNVKLTAGTFMRYAPTYTRGYAPAPEVLFGLQAANLFVFPNGERVTASALSEVYWCRRSANGDLVITLEEVASDEE